ncbi:MAG TPA: hypothetical protein DCM28_07175 [Phycisphaerales bacterium]|nr:hypothetical protein [Phycisphaerales bacterium]
MNTAKCIIPSRSKLEAFTLIELLVVISIVSLLISILLPALGAARARARQMTCMNNQRQLSLVTATYTTDHKEYFPIGLTYSDSFSGTKITWRNRLDTLYLGQNYNMELATNDQRGQSQVFGCPDFPEGAFLDVTSYQVYRGYTVNRQIMVSVNTVATNPVFLQDPSRVSEVLTAGKLGMIAEHPNQWKANNSILGKFAMDDINEGPVSWHQGSMNVAFVDGHGANYKNVDEFEKFKGTNVNNASWSLLGGQLFKEE